MLKNLYDDLINAISKMNDVQSIGKAGTLKLPETNESDIDIFIFCDNILDSTERIKAYKNLNYDLNIHTSDNENKHWGILDFIQIDKIEICLMYFTIEKMSNELQNILDGNRLEKEDNYFYPIGRCATLENINVLYDKNDYLKNIKQRLTIYPKELYDKQIKFHTNRLDDNEDIERAVARKDIFFYHFSLEILLDHYLQLLFAINHSYFPSRKRNCMYINNFNNKPDSIIYKLERVIELGGSKDTLEKSYKIWQELCKEIKILVN